MTTRFCTMCGKPATTEPNDYDIEFCGDTCEAAYYNESEYDGQPDEAQEWYDFDPEC